MIVIDRSRFLMPHLSLILNKPLYKGQVNPNHFRGISPYVGASVRSEHVVRNLPRVVKKIENLGEKCFVDVSDNALRQWFSILAAH